MTCSKKVHYLLRNIICSCKNKTFAFNHMTCSMKVSMLSKIYFVKSSLCLGVASGCEAGSRCGPIAPNGQVAAIRGPNTLIDILVALAILWCCFGDKVSKHILQYRSHYAPLLNTAQHLAICLEDLTTDEEYCASGTFPHHTRIILALEPQ